MVDFAALRASVMARISKARAYLAGERPRPMTGFWATLTPEQRKAILEYDGPEENFGPPDFPKRR